MTKAIFFDTFKYIIISDKYPVIVDLDTQIRYSYPNLDRWSDLELSSDASMLVVEAGPFGYPVNYNFYSLTITPSGPRLTRLFNVDASHTSTYDDYTYRDKWKTDLGEWTLKNQWIVKTYNKFCPQTQKTFLDMYIQYCTQEGHTYDQWTEYIKTFKEKQVLDRTRTFSRKGDLIIFRRVKLTVINCRYLK